MCLSQKERLRPVVQKYRKRKSGQGVQVCHAENTATNDQMCCTKMTPEPATGNMVTVGTRLEKKKQVRRLLPWSRGKWIRSELK